MPRHILHSPKLKNHRLASDSSISQSSNIVDFLPILAPRFLVYFWFGIFCFSRRPDPRLPAMPSPGVVTFARFISRYFLPRCHFPQPSSHANRQSVSLGGLSTPLRPPLWKPPPDGATSSVLAWSLSCYPQAVLNVRRHSTIGLNLSLPTINALGFLAYFISTAAMYFSPLIRAQYAARNPANPVPTVRANDVAFAGHALVMCFVLLSMFSRSIWGFEQGAVENGWRIGKSIVGVMLACIGGLAWMVGLVLVKGRDGGRDPDTFAWIDVVSFAATVCFKFSIHEACRIARPSRQIRLHYVKSFSHHIRSHRLIKSGFACTGVDTSGKESLYFKLTLNLISI